MLTVWKSRNEKTEKKTHYSDYVEGSEKTECCSLMSDPVWSWPAATASIHSITETSAWHDIYSSIQSVKPYFS